MSEVDAAKLSSENTMLRRIVGDLHWMARRYADGRATYVTWMFNEATRVLLKLDVDLKMFDVDGTIWARDHHGRTYDGLNDEEAALGCEPDFLRSRAEYVSGDSTDRVLVGEDGRL